MRALSSEQFSGLKKRRRLTRQCKMGSQDGINDFSGGTVGSREVGGWLVCLIYSRNSSVTQALLGALPVPQESQGET